MHLVSGQGGGPPRAVRERGLYSDQSFDALMRLADRRQERWDRRRHFEWRLTFAIWTITTIALVCAYCGVIIPVALPALIVVAQGYIVSLIHLENMRDDCVVLQLHREAEAMTHRPQILPEKTASVHGWRAFASALTDYTTVAQIGPTALAAFVLTEKLLAGTMQ